MLIKKTSKIKSFDCFQNFEWKQDIPQFEKYNFFYGWNYSGKTTLSRIFRCLEKKELTSDFNNAEFEIETDNGKITQRDINKDFPIRVFNEDFVGQNFKWNQEDHEIEPVLILGEKSIESEKELKETEQKISNNESEFKKQKELKRKKEDEVEISLTSKASEIRSILGITNPMEFDKNDLKEKVQDLKDNYSNNILSDEEYQKILSFYQKSIPREKINLELPTFNITKYIDDVRDILSKQVSATQIIEKLKNNSELNRWVRKGLDLHKNETHCQFCENPLPSDLFERLNKHFSDEFDRLMKEIENKEREIGGHISQIKGVFPPDKARLFEDLQNEYENKRNELNSEIQSYIESLKALKQELNRKKQKIFDSLDLVNINDNSAELKNLFDELKTIIDKHNTKVDNFEKEKNEAKEKIKNHLTAVFIRDFDYFNKLNELEQLKNGIKNLENEINKLKVKKANIEKQIKEEAIGADKINDYLMNFFNDDKLKVELTDNGKYKLFRDDKVAKNLSTGEKNIISLIYFFTKLEEKGFDLQNSIVFIDDPVSSLDSNHIFRVYGLLSEKLKNCGQLFITTHNFDYFNLLKDYKRYDLGNEGNFYLIKKIANNNDVKVIIDTLPKVLEKHKSEYNYLFNILYEFNNSSDKNNFGLLYVLPNIARRFLEAYLFMKYPDGKKFKEKYDKFLKDTDIAKKQTTLKLLDEYSHEESTDHSLKFPDVQEVETAINFILETLSNKDKEHYDALCNSLNE